MGVELPEVPAGPAQGATTPGAQYLAANENGLITRNGRPVFTTAGEWSKMQRSVRWTSLIPTEKWGVPFGALPFDDRGRQPDVVGDLVNALGMIIKLTEMQTARLAVQDAMLSDWQKLVAEHRQAMEDWRASWATPIGDAVMGAVDVQE